MLDYHIHPNFSIDAEDFSMEEYCIRALEVGLSEICFTPHYEFDILRADRDWFVRLNGNVVSMQENWLEEYFRVGEELRKQFRLHGLGVKLGLEVGFDLGLEREISKIVESYPFDFVLGSVHCVDHVAISSKGESDLYLPTVNMKYLVDKYFTTVMDGLKSGLFDVLGHLDIYRRYGLRHYGPEIYSAHLPYIDQVFELMVKYNLGLEINTSSFKQGQLEYYPSRQIVGSAVRQGVKVFTTGSDAHRLSELGNKVDDAQKLLSEFGCGIARFVNREIIL